MKNGFLCMIVVFVFITFGCISTKGVTVDNILADTVWVVQEGDFSDSSFSFYWDFTVKMTLRNVIDSGIYSKSTDDIYLFQFEDGSEREVHIQNNTFTLRGVTFALKSGDASDNLSMTIWWAESSTESSVFALTCVDEVFKVEPILTAHGKYYPISKNKFIIDLPEADFPKLETTGNIIGNTIVFGDLKFIKQ